MRLEKIELLAHQDSIGTQIDETLPLQQRRHNLINLSMNERLTTSNRDNWRTAFLNRVNTLLNGESASQDILRMLDFAATGTGKIALVERLQLQNQRKLFAAFQLLVKNIGCDTEILTQGDRHRRFSSQWSQTNNKRYDFFAIIAREQYTNLTTFDKGK